MLQSIRENATGWGAGLIIGFICVPFAFWGIQSYFLDTPQESVAEVDGQEITAGEFNREYQQQLDGIRNQLGENFDPASLNLDFLKTSVLQSMVQRAALNSWVRDNHYAVSDNILAEDILGVPSFQRNGKFSEEAYVQVLRYQGLRPETYEAQRRNELRLEQLKETLAASALVPKQEVLNDYVLKQQTRDIDYIDITISDLVGKSVVDDAEVQAQYEADKAQYVSAERVKASYIELTVESLLDKQVITDEQLRAAYEADLELYKNAEQRKTRHILLQTKEDDEDEVLVKIEAIKAKLDAGEDFSELAQAESDDVVSARKGGDLGMVRRGAMVPPFEDAVFAGEVGKVSDPVKTRYGWHLVLVDEIQEATTKPFEVVRLDISKTLKTEAATNQLNEMSDQLAELTYENPTTLQVAATELGLTIKTSAWFTRNSGAGVAESADFRTAMFDGTVLDDGDNTDVIEITETRLVVARKESYEASKQQELSAVRQQIVDSLKTAKAEQQAELMANELAAQAQTSSLQAAASAKGLTVKNTNVARDSFELPNGVLRTTFALPEQSDKPAVEAVRLVDGNWAVIQLQSVKQGNKDDIAAADLEAAQKNLQQQQAQREMSALIAEVRRNADVSINSQP